MKKTFKLSIGITVVVLSSITLISCNNYNKHSVAKSQNKILQNVPPLNLVEDMVLPHNKAMSLKELSIFLMTKYAPGYKCVYPIQLTQTKTHYTYKEVQTSSTFLFTSNAFSKTPKSGDVVVAFSYSTKNHYEFVISSFDYDSLVLITKGYITSHGEISKYY